MPNALRIVHSLGLGAMLWGVLVPPNSEAQAAALSGRIEVLERKGTGTDVDASLVWLEGAGLAGAPVRRFEVRTMEKAFTPRIVEVPVGSSVAFPNQDPFDHNVFASSGPKVFDLGLYGHNQSRSVTFDKPGVVRIYCNVHARMSAVVLVHASGFATRADRGGRFRFEDVAPGAYTLRIWHERGGEVSIPVTVPQVTELVVTLDARRFAFVQHLDKNGKSYDARGRRY